MANAAINAGIYTSAAKIGNALCGLSTALTVTKPDATAGAASGAIILGRIGSTQAPGQYDVAGPASPFQWYLMLTSGAVDIGYQVAYGGYTFSVAASVAPLLGHYQLSLVSEP